MSGREIESRLACIAESPASLSAIAISHEHQDHIQGAGILSRRYGVPLYMNPATYEQGKPLLGKVDKVEYFYTGEAFEINDLVFEPFSLPHDAEDPVGFIIHNRDIKIAIVTDLGYATKLVQERIKGSHLIVLEFNHDEEMLKLGPYPWPIKQRIRSKTGHLSNNESSALLKSSLHGDLQWVILAHLSAINNQPDIAESAAREALRGTSINLEISQQEKVSRIISL